ALADRNAGHDDSAVADPHIIADRHLLGPASFAEGIVDAEITEIFVRPVADLMRGDALERMLQRIDTRVGRDGAEFADGRIDSLGMPLEIREIADLDLAQHDAFRNGDVASQPAGLHDCCRMDAGLGIGEAEIVHASALRSPDWPGKNYSGLPCVHSTFWP